MLHWKHSGSWSAGFRSQLIWIYTVYKSWYLISDCFRKSKLFKHRKVLANLFFQTSIIWPFTCPWTSRKFYYFQTLVNNESRCKVINLLCITSINLLKFCWLLYYLHWNLFSLIKWKLKQKTKTYYNSFKGADILNRLTLCLLLVSSADNLCKQFGSRSGPTKGPAWSGSKLFDTLMLFLVDFFSKQLILKKSADHKNFPGGQRFNKCTFSYYGSYIWVMSCYISLWYPAISVV